MSIFNKSSISISQSRFFSQLVLDYLGNDVKTLDFFGLPPTLQGLESSIKASGSRLVDRKILVDVLKEQYEFLFKGGEDEILNERLSSLLSPDTFTVCTGHQLNLFTGPLYSILKIATTIRAAKELQLSSGKTIIPLFWMASEDHDMDEINHFYIYGQRYNWDTDWNGPAGKAPTDGINIMINDLKLKFGNDANASRWIAVLESAYAEGLTLSQATRRFLHTLFGKYGLIILDANDVRLKRQFIPEMLDDIVNHSAEILVNETINKLAENYKVQIHPRTVNLFYITDTTRARIDLENNVFQLQDGQKEWSLEEIKKEISEQPERFSPNVVLRPLYQEKILPNLAMIGGPAEVAYWLELKSLFKHAGVSFPVLILRNSAIVLDEQVFKKMSKLRIEPQDLLLSVDDWIRNYFQNETEKTFSVDESLNRIDLEMDVLAIAIESLDPTLKNSVEAEKHRIRKALKVVEEKALRFLKKQSETEVQQIHKLYEKIFPFGSLQERSENILPFLFKFGEEFITELIDELDPFSKDVNVLIQKFEL